MNQFEKYLEEKRRLKVKVIQHYIADITFFRNIFGFEQGYECMFERGAINSYLSIRKSSTALAALRNYLKFLDEEQKIDHINFLKFNELLDGQSRGRADYDPPCHSASETSFVFSNHVSYRFLGNSNRTDDEMMVVAPLIWAMSYYCGLEQRHIQSLKIKDIDLENNRIKNPYAENKPYLEEWIPLENKVFEKIDRFIKQNKLIHDDTHFLTFKGKPLNNPAFTKANNILVRSENFCFDTKVNCQSLIRTGFYHTLIKSKGTSLASQAKIYGIDNSQLVYAFTKYSSESVDT